ncbi:MAG TPA: helix-turn-helix transcriptional regulator [Cellulomonas sp.]
MDNRDEVRDFLRSRRARITPDKAGLPAYGTHRRVPGLRREEVAMLAGVSIDYYVRLERGNLAGVSESVLESVATVLQLDDAERQHLRDLARAATPSGARPRRRAAAGPTSVPLSVQAMLDASTGAPAVVRDDRLDILATNRLGRALYSELFTDPGRVANHARFAFLEPRSREFWIDWERAADDTVGALRSAAGRDPFDKALTALVGELSTRSTEFRTRWATHHVHLHTGGVKRIHHPVVGDLELMYDSLQIAAAPSLTMLVYTAAPGSSTADALQLLASWAATQDQPAAPSPSPVAPERAADPS